MQLFYQPELINGSHFLDSEESRHAIKVLRKTIGDRIEVVDGKGTFYTVEVTEANFKKCEFKVINSRSETQKAGFKHIAIAPTKNIDRIEWFVEKALEIGVDRISFIQCQNSERTVIRHERMLKKAISAMKQSIKATLPQIDELVKFGNFIKGQSADNKFIAYVDFENPVQFKDHIESGRGNLILIGPEGDFSEEEVELALKNNYEKVSLGDSRLRTETAGIAAVHLLNIFG